MMTYFKFLTLSLLLSLSGIGYSQCTIVLSTDFEGEVVEGSEKELIEQIRLGNSIRVGWQLDFNQDQQADVEHWAPANFLTIIGGQVFSQIDGIHAQGITVDRDAVVLDKNKVHWYGLLGSNGQLINRYIVQEENLEEPAKTIYQEREKISKMQVATFWASCKN